ncbi:TPA: ethanolamine utilization protein EutK, partial [Pluralibacter gergoviae]
GKVIGHKVIGRPDGDTEWLVTGFSGVPVKITLAPEPAPQAERAPQPDADATLAYVAAQARQGVTASEAAAHFGCPVEASRTALESLFAQGKLRKRSSRYRLKGGEGGNE